MSKPEAVLKDPFEYRAIFAFLLILSVALTLAVYLPALRFDFLIWDDQLYTYENETIRQINWAFFKTVFTEPVAANWHPLTMFSHAVDYALWGLNPWGHHLTSIVLHALNTGFVFILTARLHDIATGARNAFASKNRRAPAAATVAALLFGVHPIHVESVAWVAERKDVLCGFFFLLAILAYLRYSFPGSSKRVFYYIAALLFFTLALMSKPMAVSLPIVLLLLDLYPLKRFKETKNGPIELKWIIMEKVPFFALSALSSLLTLWAQHMGGAIATREAYPTAMRLSVAAQALVFYIYKMLIPLDLAPFYPLPPRNEALSTGLAVSLAVIISVSAFCVLTFRKRRVFSAVWLAYIVMLVPVIGLVQVGTQFAADRYTYLPSIGPFILIGAAGGLLYERFTVTVKGKAVYAVSAALPLVLLVSMTLKQEAVWKDTLTLWSYEIRLYPNKVDLAYNNRGLAYVKMNEYAKAIEDFSMAVAVNPFYKDGYYNRAFIYQKTGNCEQAVKDYTSAIQIKPDFENSYINRGICYALLGRFQEAAQDLEKAALIDPDNPFIHFNLGRIYSELGDTEAAKTNFAKASRLGMR